MKKYFITLLIGILCFPIAFFVFGNTEHIAPKIITLGMVFVVFSLIKLSRKYPSIKSFFRFLLELI